MAPKQPLPLARTNYLNGHTGTADPNSPSFDPSSVTPVGGYVSYGDAALDEEQYRRSLERLHGMGMHGAGVAYGMQIVCSHNAPNVVVMPGLALDAAGKHIFLAVGGSAQISPMASSPPVPVPATGVTLPTTTGYAAGTYYVIAQWRETWNATGYASDPNVSQYNDTPWLQLLAAAAFLPDVHVILGKVVLDGAGNVTAASYGDAPPLQRTSVTLPAQSLQLKRAITTAAPGADTAAWGEVRAREAGGLEIAVAKSSDQVTLMTEAGGSFSTLGVGANVATFGDLGNPGIRVDGYEATLRVGTSGNYGDVLVYSGQNHLAVSLIGDTAHAIVGGPGLNGQVRMLNASAAETMTLNADTGSAVVQRIKSFANHRIDVDLNPSSDVAGFFLIHGTDLCLDGRSQKNNRALVDGRDVLIINYAGDYRNGIEVNGSGLKVDGVLTDGGGTPLMGNPARKVSWVFMFAGSDSGFPSRVTGDVDLGSPTRFTAFCSIVHINSTTDFDYDNGVSVEVFMVDGNPTNNGFVNGGGNGGGPKWGPPGDNNNVHQPLVSTTGQHVTFRLAGLGPDMEASAIGIVFYE